MAFKPGLIQGGYLFSCKGFVGEGVCFVKHAGAHQVQATESLMLT